MALAVREAEGRHSRAGSAPVALPPILQIVGDGAAGGGTTVVLKLAQDLASRSVRVTVASQAGSYILDRAAEAGLPILPLDFTGRGKTLALSRTLLRYLELNPGTLVHAHGARATLPAALLSRARRGPLFYTVHGFHYAKKPFGMRHLAKLVERFCIQRATATIFVARHDAETAAAHRLVARSARTSVIYNGAAPVDRSSKPPRFDLSFLGRLHFQKNPAILVEILERLRPLRPSLCIIGSGHLEPELRTLLERAGLSDQVTLLGEQTHDDALRLLEDARIMILPSRWEGLPISVIEAMHRGIPVVASDVPGTRELIADGQTGFMVPTHDAAAYADRIARLLGDDDLYASMGRESVIRAREKFSIATQMDAYVRLYASAVAA